MADQAQGTDVLQVALAAAFRDGQDMVGIPQGPAVQLFQAPTLQESRPMRSLGSPQLEVCSTRINVASCANAAVPLEDLVAQIAWIGAKTPFVDAPRRAERRPARRNFKSAPAAERTAVRPLWKSGAIDEAAGHGPGGAHADFSIRTIQDELFQ